MGFNDWSFYQRVTENVIPSNIAYTGETGNPIVAPSSLHIADSGAPAIASVAFRPNPLLYDGIIEAGRIRTIFRKTNGPGFQDHGLYFLSAGGNPLHSEVVVYGLYYSSGSTSVRLFKFTNGLHSTAGTQLALYTVPFTGSTEHVVIEVEWKADMFSTVLGYTEITSRYASNTTNFGNLVDLGTYQDSSSPIATGNGPGVFVRSRSSLEPLNSVIDNTSVYRKNIA